MAVGKAADGGGRERGEEGGEAQHRAAAKRRSGACSRYVRHLPGGSGSGTAHARRLSPAPSRGRGSAGAAMLRLAPALLARLARARPWVPVRRREAAASGEEEQFVFLEYEPEPGEAAAAAAATAAAAARREREPGKKRRERRSVVGTPDPSLPPSGVSCSGCGAELHCRDGAAPGFVPAEKYRTLSEGPAGVAGLRGAVCQRCWLLAHYGRALRLRLPPEQHREVVSAALRRPPRHGRGPLLLYLLDVLELPDPVLPQLPALLGPDVPAGGLLVVGNKVDLLPADSPGHLGRLRQRVAAACAEAGLHGAPVVDVRLVSAKTGFGMEGLISRLQRSWKCAGDVYLLGATNSGKSTLFNALLRSDYCKSRATDAVNRATVSPWPGQGHHSSRHSRGHVRCWAVRGQLAPSLLQSHPWGRGMCHSAGACHPEAAVVGSELQCCTVLCIATFLRPARVRRTHRGCCAACSSEGAGKPELGGTQSVVPSSLEKTGGGTVSTHKKIIGQTKLPEGGVA